jgi:membrane-associated phospholipid phosphatase
MWATLKVNLPCFVSLLSSIYHRLRYDVQNMLQFADESIIRYLNGYAAKSEAFDKLLTILVQLPSVKYLPIVTCLVWLWFYKREPGKHHVAVVQALLGAVAALAVSRFIQDVSPHRPRPMHSETLGFVLPYGIPADILREWSSFPSDTTALAFALATGVWIASRRLGWGCLVWAAVVVAFPRIYSGFHYPTDIVCGALLGVFFTLLSGHFSKRITGMMLVQEQRLPALFYSCSFIVLFQIMTEFGDLRRAAHSFSRLL